MFTNSSTHFLETCVSNFQTYCSKSSAYPANYDNGRNFFWQCIWAGHLDINSHSFCDVDLKKKLGSDLPHSWNFTNKVVPVKATESFTKLKKKAQKKPEHKH